MPSRKANVRLIGPRTKVTSDTVIMRSSHAGGSEIIDAHRVGEIAVNLAAMLNKRGVIQPRFNAQLRSLGKRQEKKKSHSHPSVWLHCIDNLSWHYGAQRKKGDTKEESWDSLFRNIKQTFK